jgi:hypothetical protein
MRKTEQEWLTVLGLAAYLGYFTEDGEPDPGPIYWLNYAGTGPPRYRIGGKELRYRLSEVLAWMESRRVGQAS